MRVLLLAQWQWHGPARIPKALRQVGCEVIVICQKGDWASKSSFVDRFHFVDTNNESGILAALDEEVRDHRPDLILPGTDNMVSTLATYSRANESGKFALDEHMRRVVVNSMPRLDKQRYVLGKIDLLNKLGELGASVAPQQELATLGDADAFVQEHGYPVVLKPDVGFAAQGIKFCHNESELLAELDLILRKNLNRYAIQKHLGRKTALIEFVAKDGKILAANSVYRLHTHPGDTGPTSVAQVVKGVEMRRTAEILCEFLGYNGFGVAQFMVEDESCEKAWLIELNPRMSSFVHLWKLLGTDLVAILVKAWQDQRFTIEPVKTGLTVALYPQEALRDQHSPYLQGLRDSVDGEPELLKVYQDLIARKWTQADRELVS